MALGAIDKVRNIVRLWRQIPHERILETGSGEGSILQGLSDRNFGDSLSSLEISQSAVKAIQLQNIPRLRECLLFDGYDIPYEERLFDLAVPSHVLDHVEYPRRLFYEASKVARFIFVEVPLEDTVRLEDKFVFNRGGHINFYSLNTARRLAETCGLVVLSEEITYPSRAVYQYYGRTTGAVKYLLKGTLRSFSKRLASSMFTYHFSLLRTAGTVDK